MLASKYIHINTGMPVGAYRLMADEHGYILDPFNTSMKCGWGATIQEMVDSFKRRNKK